MEVLQRSEQAAGKRKPAPHKMLYLRIHGPLARDFKQFVSRVFQGGITPVNELELLFGGCRGNNFSACCIISVSLIAYPCPAKTSLFLSCLLQRHQLTLLPIE